MKMMSFLAGVAAGVVLAQTMARRGAAASGMGAAGGPVAGNDREDPPRLPPRTDEQIRERIRSQVGRTIGNPSAIQVEVRGGCVTLRGQVHARDAVLLMAEVESTRGVTLVKNELDIQGSMDEAVPPMDSPAVQAGERETSHMS